MAKPDYNLVISPSDDDTSEIDEFADFLFTTKLLKLMQSMNLQTPQQLSTLNLFQCLSQIKVSSTKYF